MVQLKVKDLLSLCLKEVQQGNGERIIVISDDNEGNGYHGMVYGFTIISKEEVDLYPIYDSVENDPDKVIVLG